MVLKLIELDLEAAKERLLTVAVSDLPSERGYARALADISRQLTRELDRINNIFPTEV